MLTLCLEVTAWDVCHCHLFYSRWPRKLGFNAWVTHSELAHAIRFQKSCRWWLTCENDAHAARNLGTLSIPYRHCVCCYATD